MARRKTKRQKNIAATNAMIGFISLFFAIIGLAELGFIGNLIMHIIRFVFGELYTAILVLQAIVSAWYIFTGHGPSLRNRITIAVLGLVPIAALLAHAWSYIDIAYSAEATIIGATYERAIANFTNTETTYNLGGGLLGALLYTMTFFTVSQLGTYIIIGVSLTTVLCYLFNITSQELIEGLQMLWTNLVQMVVYVFNHLTASWSELWEEHQRLRLEARAAKAEKASASTRNARRQKPVAANAAAASQTGDQAAYDSEMVADLEIIGPNRIKPTPVTDDIMVGNGNNPQPISELKADTPQNLSLFEEAVTALTPDTQPHLGADAPTAGPDEIDAKEDEENDDNSDIENIRMEAEEDNPDYKLPSIDLLNEVKQTDQSSEHDVILENARKLETTFKSFNVDAKVRKANLGPAVTKYEIQPAIGVKVSKIVSLADDIALALAAKDIRIEAPIPGKSFIGIEVPNQKVSLVSFRDSFENQSDTDNLLEVPLGRDISGNIRSANLANMPHLLVAGSTGSGKSVAINGMIVSILMKAKPNEVKLMMIDPKKVELNIYNGIPHLLTPVVTNPRKAAAALQKVVQEMERRYELFAATGHRNISGYNDHINEYNLENGENQPKLPFIVVIVDELADLMMVASKEVEAAITRLAQMARAAGIHMILATQRPSVDVITGIIKANVPSRMAFAVSSGIDSRTIIDQNGAEKLLGRGDMLFMPMGEGKPIRVQGAYLTDEEVERVVDFVKDQQEANYVEAMMPSEKPDVSLGDELDELFDEVLEFVKKRETVSISMLQRKFRIGYNRAARLIDDLEQRGIVSEADGSKPRKVNIFEEAVEGNES